MRRPFGDSGAVLAGDVLLVAPAAPPPLTRVDERACLRLIRGEGPDLAKAPSLRQFKKGGRR